MDACLPCLVPMMMLVGRSSYQRWWAAAAIYPENGWLNICIWIFLLLLLQLLVAHFEMMPTGHSCNDLLDHHAPAQKWNFLFWCNYFFYTKSQFHVVCFLWKCSSCFEKNLMQYVPDSFSIKSKRNVIILGVVGESRKLYLFSPCLGMKKHTVVASKWIHT